MATTVPLPAPSSEPGAASTTMPSEVLYDLLYQDGYHASPHLTHASNVLKTVAVEARRFRVHSVLDVGCSHGFAVQRLWEHNFTANGVDVSSLAVAMANRLRLTNGTRPRARRGSCAGPCFLQANAAALPFQSLSFDAIISSDALEHLTASEVGPALAELARVARRLLVLKIACEREVDRALLKKLQANVSGHSNASIAASVPPSLHATVHGPRWWLERFHGLGWRLEHMVEHVHNATQQQWWDCCTYVLVRRGEVEPDDAWRLEMARMVDSHWWAIAHRHDRESTTANATRRVFRNTAFKRSSPLLLHLAGRRIVAGPRIDDLLT